MSVTGGSTAPSTPLTIITSTTPSIWLRSDTVTIDTGVNPWPDLSGNSRHFSQSTPGLQPTYLATGGANGRPGVSFDGSDDFLLSTFTPVAAGTTPTWYAAVLSFTFTVATRQLIGTNSARLAVQSGASSGLLIATNGAASPSLSISGFKRVRAYFASSAADHFDIAATTQSGVSFGANPASGVFALGARNTGSSPAQMILCELVVCPAEPNAGELTALDAYFVGRYGAVTT
jgi:hypothetical protein